MQRVGGRKLKEWNQNNQATTRFVQTMKDMPAEHIQVKTLKAALQGENSAVLWKGLWPEDLSDPTEVALVQKHLYDEWGGKFALDDLVFTPPTARTEGEISVSWSSDDVHLD